MARSRYAKRPLPPEQQWNIDFGLHYMIPTATENTEQGRVVEAVYTIFLLELGGAVSAKLSGRARGKIASLFTALNAREYTA